MAPLPLERYRAAYNLYLREDLFFPLIGAVLTGEQAGSVYTDNADAPVEIYVEHVSGFARLFGGRVPVFESALERYLLLDRSFPVQKVRLYAPVVPNFLTAENVYPLRSERRRFFPTAIPAVLPLPTIAPEITVMEVDTENVAGIQESFGVVDRFWPSVEEFIHKSHAILILVRGKPASLCYAAATADKKAEIDVLTLPPFRGRGLGKLAVLHFVRHCREHSLTPLWDCFTNNTESMALCASVGFRAEHAPYAFFTIPKNP